MSTDKYKLLFRGPIALTPGNLLWVILQFFTGLSVTPSLSPGNRKALCFTEDPGPSIPALSNHNLVRKVLLRYNTALLSSPQIERVFFDPAPSCLHTKNAERLPKKILKVATVPREAVRFGCLRLRRNAIVPVRKQ